MPGAPGQKGFQSVWQSWSVPPRMSGVLWGLQTELGRAHLSSQHADGKPMRERRQKRASALPWLGSSELVRASAQYAKVAGLIVVKAHEGIKPPLHK